MPGVVGPRCCQRGNDLECTLGNPKLAVVGIGDNGFRGLRCRIERDKASSRSARLATLAAARMAASMGSWSASELASAASASTRSA